MTCIPWSKSMMLCGLYCMALHPFWSLLTTHAPPHWGQFPLPRLNSLSSPLSSTLWNKPSPSLVHWVLWHLRSNPWSQPHVTCIVISVGVSIRRAAVKCSKSMFMTGSAWFAMMAGSCFLVDISFLLHGQYHDADVDIGQYCLGPQCTVHGG